MVHFQQRFAAFFGSRIGMELLRNYCVGFSGTLFRFWIATNQSRVCSGSRDFGQKAFGFSAFCLWVEVAISVLSFLLLFLVPFFSVVLFEYFFVYVSLHSA